MCLDAAPGLSRCVKGLKRNFLTVLDYHINIRLYFSQVRSEEDGGSPQTVTIDDMLADKSKEKDEKKMSAEIAVMQPILRFLQLLCENHNRDLQVGRMMKYWY